MPRRPVAVALAPLIALSLVLGGAVAPEVRAQRRFSDVTDVVVVEIPVQVLRNGDPVRGLAVDDFEVRDGRKRRQILDFEEIDLSPAGVDRSTLEDIPASARRHFLLLFDLALSQPSAVLRARRAAKELVKSSLHPTDLVSVGLYSNRGAQLLLGFTPDREQIEIAIDTLGMRGLLYGTPDPLGIVLTDSPPASIPVPGDGPPGVNVEAEIRELLNQMEASAESASDRNSILALTSALGALAQMIGSVHGRKHVVFFSEGFNSAIPLGLGASHYLDQERARQQAEAAASGQYAAVDSDLRFGNTYTLGALDEMSKEFVRAGAAVHTVDIGGLRAEGDVRDRPDSEDGLFLMADKTGGEFYQHYNDFGDAFGELLERTSVTYLLTIQPEDLPTDGRYRRLTVKLKGDHKKARVVHRPGYFAPKPFVEQSPLERRLTTAELLLGTLEGGKIEMRVTTERVSTTGFAVTIEVDGSTLVAGQRGGKMPVEFFSYAIDAKGTIRDFFSKTVTFDLSTYGERLATEGYQLQGKLDLRPGTYKLRTLVRNSTTGVTGLRTSTVVVSEEPPTDS